MGKIIGSYLVKVHIHLDEDKAENADITPTAPTNQELEKLIVNAVDQMYEALYTTAESEHTDQ